MRSLLASLLALALAGALAATGCSDDGGTGGNGGGAAGSGGAGGGGSGGTGGSGGSPGGSGGGGDGGGGAGGSMEPPLVGFLVLGLEGDLTFLEDLQGTGWKWDRFDATHETDLKLNKPRDIAFFPGSLPWPADGKLLIADTLNDRIVEVVGNPYGTPTVATYSGKGVNVLKNPKGVAYDADGFIYLTDSGNHRVMRLNDIRGQSPKVIGRIGTGDDQFNNPGGLHVASDNRWIYVADTGNNRVIKMENMDGLGWIVIAPEIQGKNLSLPTNLTVDDRTRKIYVADTSNHRIVRFNDLLGEDVEALGTEGGGDLQFKDPTDVLLDATGILVVDSGVGGSDPDFTNSRLVHFTDMQGAGWTSYGKPGVGRNTGEFKGPQAVARTR